MLNLSGSGGGLRLLGPAAMAEAEVASADRLDLTERFVARYRNLASFASAATIFDAFVSEIMDPQADPIVRQSRRVDTDDRMRYRHHEIAGSYESLVHPLVGCTWRAKPPDQSDQQATDAAAGFTREIRRSPGWRALLEILGERPWRGYNGVELNGSYGGLGDISRGEPLIGDGDARPIEIPPLALTFHADTGRPRLLTKDEPINGIPLDTKEWRTKFLIGQYGSVKGGNWFGVGIRERVYWLWVFLTKNLRDWASGNERLGNPIPWAEVFEGDFSKQKTALKTVFRDLVANGGALITPKGVKISLLGDKQQFDSFGQFDERQAAAIHKAILGQTLTTEQGARGSLSLGKVHADTLTDRQWYLIGCFQAWLAPLARWYCQQVYGRDLGLILEPEFADQTDDALTLERLKFAAEQALTIRTQQLYDKLDVDMPPGLPEFTTLSKPVPAPFGMPGGAPAPGSRAS